MTMRPTPLPKRRAPLPVVIIALVLAALCCVLGITYAVISGEADKRAAIAPLAVPESTFPSAPYQGVSPKPAVTTKAPRAVGIPADSVVHVGEDVPAGTYRTVFDVNSGESLGLTGECYWKKSTDAEGQDIIANDIVEGGRPQVTLKKGQWFVSQDCGEWHKK